MKLKGGVLFTIYLHGRYITWTGNTNIFTDNRYSIFAALKSM